MPAQATVTSATLESLQEIREWLVKGNNSAEPKVIWNFSREVLLYSIGGHCQESNAHVSPLMKAPPRIRPESDTPDIVKWDFEEKLVILRADDLLNDTFAEFRGMHNFYRLSSCLTSELQVKSRTLGPMQIPQGLRFLLSLRIKTGQTQKILL
jgi:hypothetical protein